jgi:hyperosmotically inducible periplasmic protein
MNVRNAAVATAIALATLALPAHAQNAQDEPEEEKGGRTTADASEQMGDTWIAAKVKADLLVTDDVPGSAIDVDTKNGVVTLTGTVKSKAEADKAVSVAKGIKGVTDVRSKLEVGSPTK